MRRTSLIALICLVLAVSAVATGDLARPPGGDTTRRPISRPNLPADGAGGAGEGQAPGRDVALAEGQPPLDEPGATYTVRHGDTLWAISQWLDTSVAALAAANGLSTMTIWPGQRLTIAARVTVPDARPTGPVDPIQPAQPPPSPQPDQPADPDTGSPADPPADPPPAAPPGGSNSAPARFVTPPGVVLHRVAAGETLSAIAQRYDTTVAAIEATNHLVGNNLMIGQPLFLRLGATTPDSISLTTGPHGPGGGELLTWEQARWVFTVGSYATLQDPVSGKQFRVKYFGGSNHADCEPLTKADTAVVKQVAGGAWTWLPRPILVHVADRTIAASMNFMPHGIDTIAGNGMQGHFCVYFLNSRGHSSDAEDPAHQANVYKAARLPAGH